MPIVYTGGTFDLFHAGHVQFLKKCKKIAGSGKVIVALNSDEFIQEYKGSKPICSYEHRKVCLEACEYVDRVILNKGGADSKPSILSVSPDFIVIGSDWARKDYYEQMQFTKYWLDDMSITLLYVDYTEGISSTLIKQRIGNYHASIDNDAKGCDEPTREGDLLYDSKNKK